MGDEAYFKDDLTSGVHTLMEELGLMKVDFRWDGALVINLRVEGGTTDLGALALRIATRIGQELKGYYPELKGYAFDMSVMRLPDGGLSRLFMFDYEKESA